MPEALGETRWAAIRALCEGALPTRERVADAAGVYVKAISHRAGEDGWQALDFRYKRVGAAHRAMIALARRAAAGEQLDPVDETADAGLGALVPAEILEPWPDEPAHMRAARVSDVLAGQVERLLRRAEAGQPIEARQVAALSNLVALVERSNAMAREHVQVRQRRENRELGEVLEIINLRIIYLAECFAREIAARHFGMSEAEIDAKLPQPVDQSEPKRRAWDRRQKAAERLGR